MRRRWPVGSALPYAAAVLGVAAITGAIGLVRPWVELPNLTVAYLLLVLLLGARYGWPSAVSAALLAFLAYDWFLVPPYGTLWISAPRELLNLIVLVLAALAGGRLAASLAAREAGAAAEAQESSILYELAIAALSEPVEATALARLCERAVTPGGLEAMSLVAGDSSQAEVVAGAALTPAEVAESRATMAAKQDRGAVLRDGQVAFAPRVWGQSGTAFVVLGGGVAVLQPPRYRLPVDKRRLLAALLGLAGLLLDRRRTAAISERARALEASDRLKAAVLSSVSHELKSPLASLRAGLTTLQMPQAGLAPDQRELVSGLNHQTTRLDRLVGDLLAMSRLEAGLPLDQQPQEFEELVGAVLVSLRHMLEPFTLRIEIEPGLPPALADELQIERVLTNLLENAAEWTSNGAPITLGARRRGPQIEVWVQNDGPPISAEDLEQIFEKFWTNRRGGSGLGLAICRRIVEAHGGTIRADNTPEGPRFTFRLRIAHQEIEATR
jgi:two-component system, OmpR family, sensor histidine kinase KdpD